MSVLSRRGRLLPVRVGFWRVEDQYEADVLLSAVEPASAHTLELTKLHGCAGKAVYHASRNRQCHTYALTERRDARSLALRRVFSRRVAMWLCEAPFKVYIRVTWLSTRACSEGAADWGYRAVVRQLGKPALLASTYKGDAPGIAAAAMEEVEGALGNCLHELERLALVSGGASRVRTLRNALSIQSIPKAFELMFTYLSVQNAPSTVNSIRSLVGEASGTTLARKYSRTTCTRWLAEHEGMKADWAHVFLSVLPPLPLAAVKDESRIALALKSSCASLMSKRASLTTFCRSMSSA